MIHGTWFLTAALAIAVVAPRAAFARSETRITPTVVGQTGPVDASPTRRSSDR